MKKTLLSSCIIVSSLSLTACVADDNDSTNSTDTAVASNIGTGGTELSLTSESSLANLAMLPIEVQEAITGEKFSMTQAVNNTLSFMGNEERLAYDVYNALYEKYPKIPQLDNIASRSEYRHILAVQLLIRKYIDNENEFTNLDLASLSYKNSVIADMKPGVYDIQKIQSLYDALYAKGLNSERDALEVGCMVEVTDIDDLDEKIEIAQQAKAKDVEVVFDFLREGSYRHYWAFDRGLKSRGVSQGCCALGVVDGVNYCHNEYPR